jgi:hypothetical protein
LSYNGSPSFNTTSLTALMSLVLFNFIVSLI